ncbi:hypothetical protein LWI29_010784 [Acer saccharum]|uniref:Uncharacterized protein n=1 Tax=Acer saccharum TaxID=4024 RepID=A0AA39SUR4_ACESA|nr:hypothetical protein LWI29_010784 [Acer saccharum]
MECLMIVGLWCAHPARNLRPSIRQAIQGLNFELPLPNLPSKMPVPNYDVPSSSTPAPAPTAMSGLRKTLLHSHVNMIDMALTLVATTPITTGAGAAPKLSYACSNRRRLNPTKQLVGSIKLFIYTPNLSSSSSRVQPSFPVQASNGNNPQIDDPDNTSSQPKSASIPRTPLVDLSVAHPSIHSTGAEFLSRGAPIGSIPVELTPAGDPRGQSSSSYCTPSVDHRGLARTPPPFQRQDREDLNYLLKLGAGSVVGAAVIKYGSILFPEITRPNIFQALIMISTPVIVAVFLLISERKAW